MTKKEIIDQTAKDLFLKHGFKKVSIDEICRKAGVSRKTFYVNYPNKAALVIYILTTMTENMFHHFEQSIEDSEKSFSEKLKEMLLLKFEMNKEFSMEFVNDFFHPDSTELLQYLNEISVRSIALTRKFFEKAQQNGEIANSLNIDFVMWNMQKQMELCTTPEALAMFADAESMSRQMSELLIYGIIKRENN